MSIWHNYLTVGLRSLTKNRIYALINAAGLSIGITAFMLILLLVRYEQSFDQWIPDSGRIFQVQNYYRSKTTTDKFDNQGSPYVTKPALLKDFPQIEHAAYMGGTSPTLIKDGEALSLDDAYFVDGPFLDTVPLPMIAGDVSALSTPGTAVLTEAEAIKRFGTSNVIGRTVTLLAEGKKADYRVTGVLRDLPKNSHMAISWLARADFPKLFGDGSQILTHWGYTSGRIYVKLRPGADAGAINARLDAWKRRNIDRDHVDPDERTYALVNVRDVHVGKAQLSAMTPGNDAATVATFAVIAVLILAMASVNFVNLATARAGQRAREVALRKVLGASRRQLIIQFLSESIALTAIATLIALALALVELTWPSFAAFLDADLTLQYFGPDGILPHILLLILAVGVASGLYPAFYLSRFQPARVLKANQSAADAEGMGRLRGALVVGQFAVAIGLIICTSIIYGQTIHARTVDPGFQRDGLIQIYGIGVPELRPVADAMTRQIAALPGIVSVGRTGLGVATGNDSSTGVTVPGRDRSINIGTYAVDAGLFRTMGIKLVAGRVFDANRPMDDQTTPFPTDEAAEKALILRGANVVLNESGVKRLGFASPSEAIGKQIGRGVGEGLDMPLTIIGVVGDTRFRSISMPIEPIMFSLDRGVPDWMVVRYSGDPNAARKRIAAVWRSMAPDVPFDATFSEEIVARLYKQMDARARMFAASALLAVVVGCLGLLGLAAFTAERRTKEIGIRKVMGARTRDIVRLLAWQFSKPVVLANLLAWPVAWWAMRDWLNGFDARIALTPGPFALAGLLALAVALATVSGHALRVARLNPIHALRYE